MDKYKPDADSVEYFIKKKLGIMFYKIPSVEIRYRDTDGFSIKIDMNPSDYNSCLLSGTTIKNWIKEEFDITGYKLSATKFKHPQLTNGYTEFTIKFEKI